MPILSATMQTGINTIGKRTKGGFTSTATATGTGRTLQTATSAAQANAKAAISFQSASSNRGTIGTWYLSNGTNSIGTSTLIGNAYSNEGRSGESYSYTTTNVESGATYTVTVRCTCTYSLSSARKTYQRIASFALDANTVRSGSLILTHASVTDFSVFIAVQREAGFIEDLTDEVYMTATLNGTSTTITLTDTMLNAIRSSGTFVLCIGKYRDGNVSNYAGTSEIYGVSISYDPANSSIASVAENVPMDGTTQGTVTIERYGTSYTHTVKITLGTETQNFENVGASCTFTLPASWVSQVPNATKGTATVQLWTYDASGAQLGGVATAYFYAVVPDTVIPTVTLTKTIINANETVNGWGIALQGYSQIKLTATAQPGTGATIAGYAFTGPGAAQSGANAECTSNVLTATGELTYKVTVTDSRGRTASATVTETCYQYYQPAIGLSVYRCTEDGTPDDAGGTYGSATPTYDIAPCGGHNTAVAVLRYKSTGAWSVIESNAASGQAYIFGEIDKASSYTVELTVTDALGAAPVRAEILQPVTGSLFIGLNRDRVSMGMPPTRAGFDCHFDAYFRGGVTLEGDPLGVESGGTGGKTIPEALAALGAPWAVEYGGTGGNTPATAREGIGAWGKPVVLWTNASPTSTLPPQDIDIDENCPFLLCVGTNGGFILDNTERGGVLTEAHWTTISNKLHITLQTRIINRVAGGKVHIGNAYGYDYNSSDNRMTGKQDNTECILYQIWGIY